MDPHQREKIGNLYRELYPCLLQYARSSLKSKAPAEEAVQETFRIACTKADVLLSSPNPKGWLLNTLKYTVQNMIRSQKADAQLLVSYLAASQNELTFTNDRISLELEYGSMAELEEFKLIKEWAVDKKSCLEMAQSRGITVEACKKRLQRARETLRKKINL